MNHRRLGRVCFYDFQVILHRTSSILIDGRCWVFCYEFRRVWYNYYASDVVRACVWSSVINGYLKSTRCRIDQKRFERRLSRLWRRMTNGLRSTVTRNRSRSTGAGALNRCRLQGSRAPRSLSFKNGTLGARGMTLNIFQLIIVNN